jgi:hypothetical protein
VCGVLNKRAVAEIDISIVTPQIPRGGITHEKLAQEVRGRPA